MNSIAFSPDGKDIAIGWDNGQFDIRDLRSEDLRHSFKYRWVPIKSVAYSHTGRLVAVGCSLCSTVVWDMASRKMLLEVEDERRVAVKEVVFAQVIYNENAGI